MPTGIGIGIGGDVFNTFPGGGGGVSGSLYSVRFDGGTQELNYTGGIPVMGTSGTGDWTVSFWFKAVQIATGTNQRILFFQGTGMNITWYLTSTGLLQAGGAWNDSSVYSFSDGTWYNVTYVADRSNSLGAPTARGYYWVDGVMTDYKDISASTGAFPTTGSQTIIGNNPSGIQAFDGWVDEVSIWNGTLSDARVIDIYNGGSPVDLYGQSGLNHYWRMGDPNGPASYPTIVDAAYPALGSELLLNTDFSAGATYWSGNPALPSSWTITTQANYDGVTGGQELIQRFSDQIPAGTPLTAGTTVKVEFDISDVEPAKTAYFRLDYNGTPDQIFGYTNFSAGKYTYYHTLTATLDRLSFAAIITGTGGYFSINNVSLKEVYGLPLTMVNQSSANITTDVP